jgi:hypothetical protein
MVNVKIADKTSEDHHVSVSVRQHQNKFIINGTDKEVLLPTGLIVVGFGQGKWKQFDTPDLINAENQFLFSLSSSDDNVIYNGELATIQDQRS